MRHGTGSVHVGWLLQTLKETSRMRGVHRSQLQKPRGKFYSVTGLDLPLSDPTFQHPFPNLSGVILTKPQEMKGHLISNKS